MDLSSLTKNVWNIYLFTWYSLVLCTLRKVNKYLPLFQISPQIHHMNTCIDLRCDRLKALDPLRNTPFDIIGMIELGLRRVVVPYADKNSPCWIFAWCCQKHDRNKGMQPGGCRPLGLPSSVMWGLNPATVFYFSQLLFWFLIRVWSDTALFIENHD